MKTIRFIAVLLTVLAFSPVQGHAFIDSSASPEEAVHQVAPQAGDEAAPSAHSEHAPEAAGAAEEHKSGGLPQLDFSTYSPQIFWMAVIFAILFLVMSKKVLPDIGGVVNGRDTMIRSNLDEAEALKKQAEAIQAAYEKSLEQSRAEAMKAVQDVEAAAKKKMADQIEALRKKADVETKAAEERVLKQKDKSMGDMAQVAAEVASVAAEKITGIGTDMQKARAIVDSIASKAKAA